MSFNGARPKETNRSRSKKDGNSKEEDKKRKTKRKTEEDSYTFDHHLSLRLYDVLDYVGASEELRKLRQECCMSQEILETMWKQFKFKRLEYQNKVSAYYIFGSSSEGTTIPILMSDSDRLLCCKDPVVHNISEAGDGLSYLMIRDTDTQPGYVKLHLVFNRQPQTRYINPDYKVFDSEGRLCASHYTIIGTEDEQHFVGGARNGPADTDTKNNIDYVAAFRCSTIPEFARKWIVRNRQYNCPPTSVLDKMTTMGCFLVGVGHPASRERTVEWRLSFSLQERELMFNMNKTQHKCYVILKIIKKYLIEPIVGKSLSSYHLKTCMFYAIENTISCFWKIRNLSQCVLLCMCVLFKWVYQGYCPNYFIPEENMFDRDIHRRQRLNLLHQIRVLMSNGCCFLFLIKLDNVRYFKNNGYKLRELIPRETSYIEKLKVIHTLMFYKSRLCCEANAQYNPIYLVNSFLKHVSETKSMKDHTKQQTKTAVSYMLPYIHLHLAQLYASLSFNTCRSENSITQLTLSGYHFRKGRRCDLTSPSLLKATVFFKLQEYIHCVRILDQLEHDLNQNSLSSCHCSYNTNYNDVSIEQMKQFNTFPVSKMISKTSPCMFFLRSDMSITPEALKFEMFRSINTPPGSRTEYSQDWADTAVVDAIIYLHFMQYIVNAKLNRRIQKQAAIHKLESVLQSRKYLGHPETGYNLLGWIHLHEHLIPLAIKYFKKSWSLLHNSLHNAAKLHMLILIRDINA